MLEYVKRAWGAYEVLRNYGNVKLKILHVDPGKSLSLQRHFKRFELWFVVSGIGYMQDGPPHLHTKYGLLKHTVLHIAAEQWHQLVNVSETEPLVIIEIQYGKACEEKDIERAT